MINNFLVNAAEITGRGQRDQVGECARRDFSRAGPRRRSARAGFTVTMRKQLLGRSHGSAACSMRNSSKRLSESVLARLSVPRQRFTPSSCSRRAGKGGWLK